MVLLLFRRYFIRLFHSASLSAFAVSFLLFTRLLRRSYYCFAGISFDFFTLHRCQLRRCFYLYRGSVFVLSFIPGIALPALSALRRCFYSLYSSPYVRRSLVRRVQLWDPFYCLLSSVSLPVRSKVTEDVFQKGFKGDLSSKG